MSCKCNTELELDPPWALGITYSLRLYPAALLLSSKNYKVNTASKQATLW
jgi:hypothetical protein